MSCCPAPPRSWWNRSSQLLFSKGQHYPSFHGVNGKVPGWDVPHSWVFPKIKVPQNGWFIMKSPSKMDDLGVPLFSETSSCVYWNKNSFQWLPIANLHGLLSLPSHPGIPPLPSRLPAPRVWEPTKRSLVLKKKVQVSFCCEKTHTLIKHVVVFYWSVPLHLQFQVTLPPPLCRKQIIIYSTSL